VLAVVEYWQAPGDIVEGVKAVGGGNVVEHEVQENGLFF